VLRKEAVEHLQRTGNLLAIFRRTAVGLTLLAVGPFGVLVIFATEIFSRVFGDKWAEAGPVVRLLAPGLMLEFIAFPLLVIFLVTQSQRYAFRIQLASIALLLAALVVGRYYWNSFLVTCALMSVAMLVTNGLVLLAAFATSKPARPVAVESVGVAT
jgi:O-antigen/teichoic acid export membrane protein